MFSNMKTRIMNAWLHSHRSIFTSFYERGAALYIPLYLNYIIVLSNNEDKYIAKSATIEEKYYELQ